MVEPLLPDGRPWAVVDEQDLSVGRRRLAFLFPDGAKRWVTVASDADTPERRERIAQALQSDRQLRKTPRGPEPPPGRGPSGWLESAP